MNKEIKKNLEEVHTLFLSSIKNYVLGEFLVGSSVYADEKDLSEKSDLDIVCIINENNLKRFLCTKYLSGLIDPTLAEEVLNKDISDYLVLKTKIKRILLSIDVITINFFNKICAIDLVKQNSDYISYKFGNELQINEYSVEEFNGKEHMIKKKCSKFKQGYSIELPLFFIRNGKYVRGIPTIKYLTHKIFYDPLKIIRNNINVLYKSTIRRLLYEYPLLSREEYHKYFLNLLKGRNKFPEDYRKSILNRIDNIINMENHEDKIEKIKQEVYLLFKENAKNDYTNPDWIFPNHFDIMSGLVKEMYEKYGGNLLVCELAVLLHDVGLVYKRETQSSEGHEKRSIEYARDILKKYEVPEEISKEVIECIFSTEKDKKGEPKSLNARILRTADILSQFISVHYFAKASFFNNLEFFIEWVRDRVESCYSKISFEDEKKIAKPIRDYMLKAIELYNKHKKDYPLNFDKKEGEGYKSEHPKNN